MYRGKCSGKQKYKKKQSATIFERVVALFYILFTQTVMWILQRENIIKKSQWLHRMTVTERNVNEENRREVFDEPGTVLAEV